MATFGLIGHFLRRARPFEHGAGPGLGPVLVQGCARGCDAAFMKRREHGAGADRIDPDAVRGVVQRQVTGQARHRRFRGIILEVVAPATMARTEAMLAILPPPA
jgi:hypothetical protein